MNNLIVMKEGKVIELDAYLLSSASVGHKVKVVGVDDSSKELLEYLNDLKISLGTAIEVLKINSFDNSLQVNIDENREALFSSKVANSLKVVEQ